MQGPRIFAGPRDFQDVQRLLALAREHDFAGEVPSFEELELAATRMAPPESFDSGQFDSGQLRESYQVLCGLVEQNVKPTLAPPSSGVIEQPTLPPPGDAHTRLPTTAPPPTAELLQESIRVLCLDSSVLLRKLSEFPGDSSSNEYNRTYFFRVFTNLASLGADESWFYLPENRAMAVAFLERAQMDIDFAKTVIRFVTENRQMELGKLSETIIEEAVSAVMLARAKKRLRLAVLALEIDDINIVGNLSDLQSCLLEAGLRTNLLLKPYPERLTSNRPSANDVITRGMRALTEQRGDDPVRCETRDRITPEEIYNAMLLSRGIIAHSPLRVVKLHVAARMGQLECIDDLEPAFKYDKDIVQRICSDLDMIVRISQVLNNPEAFDAVMKEVREEIFSAAAGIDLASLAGNRFRTLTGETIQNFKALRYDALRSTLLRGHIAAIQILTPYNL